MTVVFMYPDGSKRVLHPVARDCRQFIPDWAWDTQKDYLGGHQWRGKVVKYTIK